MSLKTTSAEPYAEALSLAMGAITVDHGLFAPVQPSPSGDAWQVTHAGRWPVVPLWDQVAASGVSATVVGWPGTHGAVSHPRRTLISDLDLALVDVTSCELSPLRGREKVAAVRVTPADLDPAVIRLLFNEKPAGAHEAAVAHLQAVGRAIALIYSVHNTAIEALRSGVKPGLLALHYTMPTLPSTAGAWAARVRESSWRLLDLLLGDLRQHAAGAELTLVGLGRGSSFLVTKDADAPTAVNAVAPRLAKKFGPALTSEKTLPFAMPIDEAELLARHVALGHVPAAMLNAKPTPAMLRRQQLVRGGMLLAADRAQEAMPLLAPAWFETPEDLSLAFSLYDCLHRVGLRAEARVGPGATLRDQKEAGVAAQLVEADLALHRLNEPERALKILEKLARDPRAHGAAALYRETLLTLRRYSEARALLETAVADGTATANSHAGLAYACYQQGELTKAESAATRAIELGCTHPHAAKVLELIKARRERRKVVDALPTWTELMEQATEREACRARYAALRSEFLAARAARRAPQSPLTFRDGTPAIPTDASWIIVTGLPRAGQSLVLRMLAFGGLPVLTDGRRQPDAHNPLGHFDWEPATRLRTQPRVIDDAANHALKLPAESLQYLPRDRRYRVLFVTRHPREQAQSQAMVRGVPFEEAAVSFFEKRTAERLAAARAQAEFDVMEVPFSELRETPAEWAERIATFLGHERLPRPQSMARAVHPDLPRHRKT